MNVLLSSFVRWWNAEAAYAATLAEGLREAGHRVWVLTTPGTRNEAELRRRELPLVTHLPPGNAPPWRWWGAVSGLAAFQRENDIDVVNVFRSQEYPLHVLANRLSGGRAALVRTRGTDRAIRRNWLNTKLHRDWCDGHIAASGVVQERMVAALHLPPESIQVIYYPAFPEPQPNDSRKQALRLALLDELGFDPDTLLLAIVGRLYPEKGHAVALEALEELVVLHPQVRLVILAKNAPGEDPERPVLEAMVARKGLEQHVRFLNFREDVQQLMGGIDVGVVPSLASEVNCRVAVEFFTAGTPVVAFPTGALPEVVENGISGLVTEDYSPEVLTATLARIAGDADLRKRLGEGAGEAARNRFSRVGFVAATLAAYEAAKVAKGQPRNG